MRVDKGTVRELVANRTLDKDEKTIYCNLPITDQEAFLKELQKGTTLPVRVYNETPVTLSFSLSGAYAVVKRMQKKSYKEERRQKAINSDPYFKDEL